MMDGLANGADTMECPHCGKEMRRGMIRCRECGKSVTEASSDFELTGHELRPSQEAKCPLCGAVLVLGATDCAACTSDLLDQLLKGPEPGPAVQGPHSEAPARSTVPAKLRVHRAAGGKAATPTSATG